MEYNYSIIDSDAVSNLQLRTFLVEYGDFSCVGNLKTPSDGLNNILKYAPDVIFVNLNNKAAISFQMIVELHQYVTSVPIIIGIAKTKDFAYEALKNNFFDYWLQPYNEFDIRKSLLKLMKKLPKQKTPQTICLKSYNDFHYLDTSEILYLQADNNTTEFHMKGDTVTHAYKTLKTFENQLPANFIRIHQSYIVNTNYVSRINFGKSICVLKNINKSLPFSKSYRANMDNLKKTLSQNTVSALN